MNIQRILYDAIGHKIRSFRVKEGKKQQEFLDDLYEGEYESVYCTSIDRSTYSYIESGKARASKNRYLLSDNHVETFSSLLYEENQEHLRKKLLIIGDDSETEDLIKFILIALLMNEATVKNFGITSKINPFLNLDDEDDYNFFKLALFNLDDKDLKELNIERRVLTHFMDCIDRNEKTVFSKKEIKSYKNLIIEKLSSLDNFFFNSSNYYKYELIDNNCPDNFEALSNTLSKLLLSNLEFSTNYITRKTDAATFEFVKFFVDFQKIKGNYGASIIGYKEKNYRLFITAFNEMCDKYMNEFLECFNSNLFNKIDKANKGFMKIVTEESLTQLLLKNFSLLINKIYSEEQMSFDSFAGHQFARLQLMNTYDEHNRNQKDEEGEYTFDYYLNDMRNLSEYYALQNKDNIDKDFLLYIEALRKEDNEIEK